jgi:WD40 repeat protein
VFPQSKIDYHYQGSRVNHAVWSHNNVIVASGGDDGQIILSKADNGQKMHTFNAYQSKTVPVSGGM